MLWFVGLGISGISELSEKTISVIKDADIVYLESFTSPISESEKDQLKNMTGGEFKIAKRWLVEDGNEILENAQKNETVLDFCMGSGSTGVAAINLNRNFIGIEKEIEYFKIAKKRVSLTDKEK